jgi:hypothetical protein
VKIELKVNFHLPSPLSCFVFSSLLGFFPFKSTPALLMIYPSFLETFPPNIIGDGGRLVGLARGIGHFTTLT